MEESLRETKISQNYELSNQMNEKQRFGLFSQPAPLAIGDTNKFPVKKGKSYNISLQNRFILQNFKFSNHFTILCNTARRAEDGQREVIIDPPNIKTGPAKRGKTKDALFQKDLGFNCLGDPFKEAGAVISRKTDVERQRQVGNEKAFRPVKNMKYKYSDYVHETDYVEIKKNFRNPDPESQKEVMIGPRNILTNPMKKGKAGKNTLLGEKIPYIEDDYNRAKELQRRKHLQDATKFQEKPFSQRVRRTETFNKRKDVFGEDIVIPEKPNQEKRAPLMEHDKPFFPASKLKKGYNRAEIPKYIEDPPKKLTRQPEKEEERPRFKPTHNYKSRP